MDLIHQKYLDELKADLQGRDFTLENTSTCLKLLEDKFTIG